MGTFLIIWIFLFFIIALFLVITATRMASNQLRISKIVVKLFFSFLVHIPVSAVTGFLLLFITVGPDPHQGRERQIGSGEVTAGFIIIISYALIGWLLCSFVNGKLLTSLSVFNFYSEKPQSIFDVD